MSGVRIDGYPIDLALSEEHSLTSEVTKSPVEKGADITDHVKSNPIEIHLEGIVSDTPIGAIAKDSTRTSLAGATLPSQDAWTRLQDLHDNPKLVTVETSLGKFDSMMLTELTVPREKDTTKALKFTVTFERINVLQNNRTTIRVAVPMAGKKPYLGNKESQDWGKSLGLKDVIYVISIPTNLSVTWAKSFGKPIHRRKGAQEFDCFEVKGDTQPDGFLTINSSKTSTDKYTYHPLSDLSNMGGAASGGTKGLRAGSTTQVGEFIGDRPVHFDYADSTWKDDRDDSVVRKVPTKPSVTNPKIQYPINEEKWKGVTVIDPQGHRQSY